MTRLYNTFFNIRDSYEEYQSICVSCDSYVNFRDEWVKFNHEIYLRDNPNDPVSLNRLRKRSISYDSYGYIIKREHSEKPTDKLIFTIKLACNEKIIVQRYFFIKEEFILTEKKLKEVALMVDDYVYPEGEKSVVCIDVIMSLEMNGEEITYEMPLTYKRGERIDIKPIMKDIGNLIFEKKES